MLICRLQMDLRKQYRTWSAFAPFFSPPDGLGFVLHFFAFIYTLKIYLKHFDLNGLAKLQSQHILSFCLFTSCLLSK